jgi:RNA polymerase sigma factor for flagellar operon FliA
MSINRENQILQEKVAKGDTCLRPAAMKAYSSQQSEDIVKKRIEDFLPIVPKIVNKTVSYLKPPLTFEDVVSAGMVGLVKAARNYDESHNADFKTYAYIRVRGAVLDELRKWSFVPSEHNKKIKQLRQTTQKLTDKNGDAPSDKQIAQAMQVTIEELYDIMERSRAQDFLSLDKNPEGDTKLGNIFQNFNANDPYDELEKKETIQRLTEAITQLPKKHRQIIVLYYQQELTMKQIAEVMSISEPRVSQLHSSAVFRLSVNLRGQENER